MIKQMKVISDARMRLGEGPRWCEQLGMIVWIDIEDKKLWGYHWASKHTQLLGVFDKRPGCVNPLQDGPGDVVIAFEDGLYGYQIATQQLTLLQPLELGQSHRFNDGKCDPQGRLWVGSMHVDGDQAVGELFRFQHNHTPAPQLQQLTVSNGMAWRSDAKTFYFIDSPTRMVQVFDYDQHSGHIANPRTACRFEDGMGWPDGMCIDADDRLWIAHWAGSQISCWDAVQGRCLWQIPLPTQNITSLIFVGPELDHICVTTASIDHDAEALEAEPLAGHTLLLSLDVNVKGIPTRAYHHH